MCLPARKCYDIRYIEDGSIYMRCGGKVMILVKLQEICQVEKTSLIVLIQNCSWYRKGDRKRLATGTMSVS